jgi:hypothetical protein
VFENTDLNEPRAAETGQGIMGMPACWSWRCRRGLCLLTSSQLRRQSRIYRSRNFEEWLYNENIYIKKTSGFRLHFI